jgi:hypothetical protein
MSLAPEDRLLLACARNTLRPQDVARAADALASAPDWTYLLEASIRHAVAPLLDHGLRQVTAALPDGQVDVPARARAELDQLHAGNRERSRRLHRILGDIVTSFQASQVPVLGLKDIQLAVEVYADRALRPMGDVDLLVRREHWSTAAHCLRDLGFEPQPAAHRPFTSKYAGAQQFRRASDETWVDLQWHVAEMEWDRYGQGRFTFDTDRLWRGAVPLRIEDYELLAPCPVDMLIHLCLHLEGHQYCELVLFCDIVAFLEKYEGSFDWDTLIRVCRESGAASAVYHVLLLTSSLFDVRLQEGLLDALRPAYFRGRLAAPLFGNLGSLHEALDDIAEAASPPADVLADLEVLVRRQAARAMQVEAELDDLANDFVDADARLILFAGGPSPRRFPDGALPAFAGLEVFVLAEDGPLLQQSLDRRGFVNDTDRTVTTKHVEVATGDPVLAGLSTSVTIDVRIERDLQSALDALGGTGMSNRVSAVRSLKERIAGSGHDDQGTVAVTVRALSRSELLLCLASALDRREDGQLFEVCGLLELMRSVGSEIDAEEVARLAARAGVSDAVATGVAIAAGILRSETAEGLGRKLPVTTTPRILTWARYGPSSLKRYPELRAAYLYLLCLLGHKGLRRRVGFIGASARTRGEAPAVLPRLVRGLVAGTRRRLEKGTLEASELAYWVERPPELVKE